MFTRVGSAAYKGDLNNIRALSSSLGDPHLKLKCIHVGGTNGKGSVSHMLAAILQEAGYRTALFTSPHLYDFRERIRIDGEMIDEEAVVSFVEKVQPLVEQIKPSFFEITAAMAFDHFARSKVDIAVIEVGLGGRLDSTNIILPELSVITNISWDHMNILGDSLQAIAGEKAGIIKEHIPVVIGERQSDVDEIFIEKAKDVHAQVIFAEDHYRIDSKEWIEGKLCADLLNITENRILNFCLDLPGIYQEKNLCTVLAAVSELRRLGYSLESNVVHSALREVTKLTGFRGRWEKLQEDPTIILDVAHNHSGIGEVVRQLDQYHFEKLHIVIGMVKDKEAASVLALLPKHAQYYFTNAHIPRALAASDLQQMAAMEDLRGDVYEDVNAAIKAAKENADINDLILVCGSVFLVAEVERAL
jgi:dihydrofolate synthase/folylpolyglutamate synthase